MQRNILKIALVCGMALFLAAAPVHLVGAAETAIDTGAQSTDASQLRETYHVTAQNGLKMRSAPSTDSDVITLLPYGAEVTVTGTSSSGWYEIEYKNDSGYVAAKYIAKSDETDAGSGNETAEAEESVPSTEQTSEGMQSAFGTAPVITALIAAIIIMVILAVFTAYSFLKKEKNSYDYDDDDDDEYYNSDDDDTEYYNNGDNDDAEYYGEEYYDDDEEYYDDEE